MSDEIKIKTVGFDARFPNTNQSRHCFQNYVDYFRCIRELGEEHSPCDQFKSAYRSLCPGPWTERWDEQREAGVFPALREEYKMEKHLTKMTNSEAQEA